MTNQAEYDDQSPQILTPNMYLENVDVRQSTWRHSAFLGSLFAESSLDESQFLKVNLRTSTFVSVTFAASRLVGCSLRDVVLEECDVTGLVVNGVRVGDLLAAHNEGAR